MIEALVFIPLVIVALTQLVKRFVPKVHDEITILVALLVGVVVAIVDVYIGVTDISIAQGLVLSFTAIGLNTLANKAGGKTEVRRNG